MDKPFAITLDVGSSRANKTGSWRTERPEYVHRLPPCNRACPAGEDIQAWLYDAEEGGAGYERAWRTIMIDNPFPAIMGRVCYHPCEDACNRVQIDDAVGINSVERFLGDEGIRQGWRVEPSVPPTGKRVLVIGAGPSGLSAAYHLALRGHAVTIHEAGAAAGGMMRYGIPRYRLPRDILDAEVQRILDLGVTLRLNTGVSSVQDAMRDGAYDAVFLAVGAQIGRRAYIPAGSTAHVVEAMTMLHELEDDRRPLLGRRVAVYGGGNTATDAARTAKRLGADEAIIVYRRTRDRMPAHDSEVREAQEEGVLFKWLSTVTHVDEGRLTIERMALDDTGFPQPTGEFETLEADSLVLALGQDSDLGLLEGLPGIQRADGCVVVDEQQGLRAVRRRVPVWGDQDGRGADLTRRVRQNRPVTTVRLDGEPDECWWGGAVPDGLAMPFGQAAHSRDLATNAGQIDDPAGGANQSAPLLVSSTGRYVWSEQPFAYAFDGAGGLEITGDGIVVDRAGDSLRSAYRGAAERFFPASGWTPAELMFTAPQYNTWIELPYHPTQEGVLAYARGVLDNGFPPGLIMIDDRWSVDYGTWRFEPGAFPDPRAMIEQLHAWGFAVMLWLVPFLSPDSENSRRAVRNGWVITGADGEPAVRQWWNGYSTVLDLTHPEALGWLRGELAALQELGVDGFKLDAGDLRDYRLDDHSAAGSGPAGQCEAWARFATEFTFNELRACWKMGGQSLAQRLHDKPRTWGADGLLSLIPEGIAQGLIGHAFGCPDMIAGGELGSFADGEPIDQELFVRFAQCSALFSMMQFSLTPWRVLDDHHLAAVHAAVDLRQSLLPMIMELVAEAARTGEPVLRPLAYHHRGYERVHDQFLLGEDLLVAPVLERGATTRTVLLPPGRWADESGTATEGPTTITVGVGLDSVPHWRRLR